MFGLSQLKTPADKKIKNNIGNKYLKKIIFKQVQRNARKKTFTQIIWYIQNYRLSSNDFRYKYFR